MNRGYKKSEKKGKMSAFENPTILIVQREIFSVIRAELSKSTKIWN